MLNIVAPYHTKNVKCNSLGLALAIVTPLLRGNFVHYDFHILHYISHKMKYISPHATYVTRKITLNVPDNVYNMTYSHFFVSSTGLRTSYNTVAKF